MNMNMNNGKNENIIETMSITKRFGKHNEIIAVDSLSLNVKKGEIFGFVGPNGAGKTTTMKMLIGLLEPTSGSGKVAGFDIVREVIKIREATGVLPEPAGYYDNLTARQNLRFYARLYDIDDKTIEHRIIYLLELVGIGGAMDQRMGGFSTGMRKRFGLAQALINEPDVLFLDEPTSGIDPIGAQMMRDFIKKLSREKGVTVFLSSHSMAEVEEICDRIGIIVKGRLIATGTTKELRDRVNEIEGTRYLLEVIDLPAQIVIEGLKKFKGVRSIEPVNSHLSLLMDPGERMGIAVAVKSMGGTIARFEEEKMNLQRVFMKLVEKA
jgi:ABC-2 type transport system ATP-binding protein